MGIHLDSYGMPNMDFNSGFTKTRSLTSQNISGFQLLIYFDDIFNDDTK